tara:strand:- start:4179 stop:4508 length:330 start_codon:yes stop_codon:yes gene_type:complete
MAITTTWSINTIEREVNDGYVYNVHYAVNAVSDTLDPEGNPYSQGAYGSIGLERPEGALIPYENLTEERVVGWVQQALGGLEKVIDIENALEAAITEKISPTKIAGVPW